MVLIWKFLICFSFTRIRTRLHAYPHTILKAFSSTFPQNVAIMNRYHYVPSSWIISGFKKYSVSIEWRSASRRITLFKTAFVMMAATTGSKIILCFHLFLQQQCFAGPAGNRAYTVKGWFVSYEQTGGPSYSLKSPWLCYKPIWHRQCSSKLSSSKQNWHNA